jgi:AcrR family transcriptional regulator
LNNNRNLSDNHLPARKIDRRVIRTRRLLRDALFALVLEKGFDAVTIEEITERADLGRTTFYLHYRDKEDLLMQSISELVEDLIERMSHLPQDEWVLEITASSATPSPAILLPFQHVAAHARLYRIILRGEGTYTVSRRLREIIVQASGAIVEVLLGKERIASLNPQVPLEVFLNYLAGAWIGLITWWLENEMPYSQEQMALMFQKMIMHGAPEIVGS